MSGTDAILGNVNGVLRISEFSDTSDQPIIGNIDISGLQETALIAPDVASLSEAQTSVEIGSSALSTTVPLAFDEEIALPAEATETTDLLTGLSATEAAVGDLDHANALPHEAGIFTVDESGQVSIDFLFDGGKFKSELAIFSLSGMDAYEAGSTEFIQEAARRALSNSTEGYVVISDREEGARFDGVLGEHEGRDWNNGEYLGVKSFAMNPGEQFGFMLTVKDNVQKIFDNPNKYLDRGQPLFSMAEANPDREEQIADITGDQNTFGFEDLTISQKSDEDFNDLIFKMEGANGETNYLGGLFDENTDWRNSEAGQNLIEFVVDPEDLAGNTPDTAYRSSPSTLGKLYRGWLGENDLIDYYSFSLGTKNNFRLEVDGLYEDINIQVLDLEDNVVFQKDTTGTQFARLNTLLEAGAYRVRLSSQNGLSTTYNLKLYLQSTISGITTGGSEVYVAPTTSESLDLINLNRFRSGDQSLGSDPRFKNIDGRGFSSVIIDTGIDLEHSSLKNQIVYSFNFVDDNADATDDTGHGTHVAGIVDAVAPRVDLVALRSMGQDSGQFSDTEQALQWVIANAEEYNIASVNMSLGEAIFNNNGTVIPGIGNYTVSQNLYGLGDELAALASRGVIVTAAAGNDYFVFNTPGITYPAADPNTIAVGAVWDDDIGGPVTVAGATDDTTDADRITAFSQRHPTLMDIFAPGAEITSAAQEGGTEERSGTSMAAPHVAGMAVLSQQLADEQLARQLTPEEFRQLLRDTADLIWDGDDEDYGNVNPSNAQYRRADMLALAEAIMDMRVPTLFDIDLIGDSFNVLGNDKLSAGDSFDVEFGVLNSGLDSADSFDVSFYLSENETISQRDIFLGRHRISGVTGNSVASRTKTLTLPSGSDTVLRGFKDGDAYIGMIIDSRNEIGEVRERNNRNVGWQKDYDDIEIESIQNGYPGLLTLSIDRFKTTPERKSDASKLRKSSRRADAYPIIYLDGSRQTRPLIRNKDEFNPGDFLPNGWRFSQYIESAPSSGQIPIEITIRDSDPDEHDFYDIDSSPFGQRLNIAYDPLTGEISGDQVFRIGDSLYASGGIGGPDRDPNNGDIRYHKAEIWFSIDYLFQG
ncbi:MAG: S8 family serine peptidase [Leptolyngbya sp. SIO1E4]|nr:S8 family serine peptidase [Leptolyngbya sp. SIO1E4]